LDAALPEPIVLNVGVRKFTEAILHETTSPKEWPFSEAQEPHLAGAIFSKAGTLLLLTVNFVSPFLS